MVIGLILFFVVIGIVRYVSTHIGTVLLFVGGFVVLIIVILALELFFESGTPGRWMDRILDKWDGRVANQRRKAEAEMKRYAKNAAKRRKKHAKKGQRIVSDYKRQIKNL